MSWWNLTGYEPVIPNVARATLIAFQKSFDDYVERTWDKRRKDPEVPAYVDKRDERTKSAGRYRESNARESTATGWCYVIGKVGPGQQVPPGITSLDAVRR